MYVGGQLKGTRIKRTIENREWRVKNVSEKNKKQGSVGTEKEHKKPRGKKIRQNYIKQGQGEKDKKERKETSPNEC